MGEEESQRRRSGWRPRKVGAGAGFSRIRPEGQSGRVKCEKTVTSCACDVGVNFPTVRIPLWVSHSLHTRTSSLSSLY